jgi:hypothetical protein
MTLRRVLYTASLCGALLALPSAMPAHASAAGAHASIASTSRWWKLECGKTGRKREAETTACAFTVKLYGVIDASRLQLVRHALQRRDTVRRALHRDVDFQVNVDSQGGEIFATLEIGRLMRAEGASIAVGPGASCISACVFLLMGRSKGPSAATPVWESIARRSERRRKVDRGKPARTRSSLPCPSSSCSMRSR